MKADLEDIPQSFYSFETKEPFSHCIECKKELDEQTDYIIEKAMRRYPNFSATDTLFDYAMCMDCALEMRKSLSVSSRKKMDEFFQPYFQKISVAMHSAHTQSVEEQLSKCLITEKDIRTVKEYQIYAVCRGKKINRSVPAYMISEEAIEQILPLLSNETTDFLNGFFERHFNPDPSMLEPIGPKLILV